MAAALVVCVATLVPMPDASAQATGSGMADVEQVRYGGADRYATSLIVAEAFAEDSGGKLDSVVVVSGLSWPDAVVSASVAGRMGAPVLLTPPDAVRDDALAYLRRVGASRVVLVSTDAGSERSIGLAVDEQFRHAGLTVERVGGADRYHTSVALAEQLGEVGLLVALGKTAIIGNGQVFADALVAGPLAARAGLPVLLTPQAELHAGVAEFLMNSGVERVVLMGGTAALSADVETAIEALGIETDRIAGATRFETAALAATYAAQHTGGGCFTGPQAGLARAHVPFDSFSAAPLLARHCAALVLADPGQVPVSTAEYLDGIRRRAGDEHVKLFVFGGEAAISQSAIDAYLNRVDDAEPHPPPPPVPPPPVPPPPAPPPPPPPPPLPPLPSASDIAADTARAAAAAETSAAAAGDAAAAAKAIADSQPAAAADASAATAAARLSDTSSKLARYHADIAADHTTVGSDRHCHPRAGNICHSHLDSEPYARSAVGAQSAAEAHAHAAAAHAAHARAALIAGTISAEVADRVAQAAALTKSHADAAKAAAEAAWDAVHEGDTRASAGHSIDAHAAAAKAATARAAAAF